MFDINEGNYFTVGELRSGVMGFATIYATGSHRFLVQLHTENLSHKDNYSNLTNKQARIYNFLYPWTKWLQL